MRMWMADPKFMCRQHLLGEHRELHTLQGSLTKGRHIKKHIDFGQLEPLSAVKRHVQLVKEMKRRGYNHKSPIGTMWFTHLYYTEVHGKVDRTDALKDLINRCPECRDHFAHQIEYPRG